ncbi:MAG: tRNA (adenosine(37)-N6)-threonylcarbamoyltransferase complex ATPase subunit type 1 TsaE [Balneolaceae bacterium]
MKEVITRSEEETLNLAAEIGRNSSPGDVLCLKGELGAGKTHFVKGFVTAFGIDSDQVSSPTFSLINEYIGNCSVYHFDCFRLEKPEEALEIGAEEYFYGDGVCIIEWPDRIASILPGNVKYIEISSINSTTRSIRLPD